MLAIRLQRHGRKKLPIYRMVVQEANRHPSSGRVVTFVGTYDPRSKDTNLDKEKVEFYLKNGARPSERVVSLLEMQKVKLPKWIEKSNKKERPVKNAEKLRKNQPKEEATTQAHASAETSEAAEKEK